MKFISTGTTRVSDGLLTAHTHTLTRYSEILRTAFVDGTYTTPESALAASHDTAVIESAETIARELSPTLKTVILIGIGGSNLGTRALYDALGGYTDAVTRKRKPRLVCFDTFEPNLLTSIDDLLSQHTSAEEIVLVIISKSGTTPETMVNANIVYHAFKNRFGGTAAKRTLFISDADVPTTALMHMEGIRHVAMPKHIGGRFSIFTSVGLVPLALLGIDIRSFCEGGSAAARAAVPEQGPGPAATLAALLFEHYLTNISIHELFLFHPELESLGKWYRQLLAESIGKERADGTRVGITPTVAIGTTDLHSMAQLVVGGPRNRFTSFVVVPGAWSMTDTCSFENPFVLDTLRGKNVGEIFRAILNGVQTTYRDNSLPYVTIEFECISPRELGAFMALHMAAIMYLGKLFDVNTFDQPAVEAYKREAHRLLTHS